MTLDQLAKMQAGRQAKLAAERVAAEEQDAWHVRVHSECAANAAVKRARLWEAQ